MPGPKLVLLTDFSPLSKVAMKFALKMAVPLNAEFTILNIVRVEGASKSNFKLKQIEKEIAKISDEDGQRLVQELRDEIKGSYTLEFKAVRAHTVSEMVKRYTEKHPTNMVVMGSRGASAIKKARMGGTTVSVVDESDVPVLAIPHHAHFKNLQHIVYASDLKNVQKELDILIEFAKIFGSHVHMIHVVPAVDKKVEAAAQVVETIIRKINYNKLDFKLIIDDNVPAAIDRYIKETHADLLTAFTHHLSLIEKLFAKSVTRTLAYLGTIPLLALKRK